MFAFLVDPIIRMMHSVMDSEIGRTTIGAYADDCACVVCDYTRDIPKLLQIFELARSASALTLKFRKCVLAPLNIFEDICDHEVRLKRAVPQMATSSVEFSARYLGVTIGPKSHVGRWKKPSANLVSRSRWIRDQNSVCTSRAVGAYQSYVLGGLLFHAQFYRIDDFFACSAASACYHLRCAIQFIHC